MKIITLKEQIKFKIEQDLKTPKWRRTKPSYPINSETIEDWMERPGMDTRSYAFHWQGNDMVEGR